MKNGIGQVHWGYVAINLYTSIYYNIPEGLKVIAIFANWPWTDEETDSQIDYRALFQSRHGMDICVPPFSLHIWLNENKKCSIMEPLLFALILAPHSPA